MTMETLANLSWRLYLALPLMAVGAAGAVRGPKGACTASLALCAATPHSWSP
jgi:hypothetical protein